MRLAGIVRSSGSVEQACASEVEELGEPQTCFFADVGPAIPSFDTDEDRELYLLGAKLLEGKGLTDGIVHQQVATRLLEQRSLQPFWASVSYLGALVREPIQIGTRQFDLTAKEYLTRLAEYRFTSWPARAREALGAVVGENLAQSRKYARGAGLVTLQAAINRVT